MALVTQPCTGRPEGLVFTILLRGAGGVTGEPKTIPVMGPRAPSTLVQCPAAQPVSPACAAVTKAVLGQAVVGTPARFSWGPPDLWRLQPFLGCHVLSGFQKEAHFPTPTEAPQVPPPASSAEGSGDFCQDECSFSPSTYLPPGCKHSLLCPHGSINIRAPAPPGWDRAAGGSPLPPRWESTQAPEKQARGWGGRANSSLQGALSRKRPMRTARGW